MRDQTGLVELVRRLLHQMMTADNYQLLEQSLMMMSWVILQQQ